MDHNSIEGRYTAQIITKFEAVVAKAILHERRQWAEAYQALQREFEQLRSENVRLSVLVQSHQLESTNRALWLKRKAESAVLNARPTKIAKLSGQEDPPSQGFAPPTPSSSRALSTDGDGDEAEGSRPVPADTVQPTASINHSDATRRHHPQRPSRPISRLPSRAQSVHAANASLPRDQENELERVVYCLCGAHEYGLMIHCDNPKCELVWFHAGCVNLKEVPAQEEEWFCPACTGSRIEKSLAPVRQLANVAVQATTRSVDLGCQTNPVEPPTQMPSPCDSPQKRPLSLILPHLEIVEEQPPQLLPPFVLRSDPNPDLQLERPVTPLPMALGQMSPCSTLTPLSTSAAQTPRTLGFDSSFIDLPREQDVVLIHVAKKLMRSSRKSLFRSLQPTARKPWIEDFDNV